MQTFDFSFPVSKCLHDNELCSVVVTSNNTRFLLKLNKDITSTLKEIKAIAFGNAGNKKV
jgi:hypothetical protein